MIDRIRMGADKLLQCLRISQIDRVEQAGLRAGERTRLNDLMHQPCTLRQQIQIALVREEAGSIRGAALGFPDARLTVPRLSGLSTQT